MENGNASLEQNFDGRTSIAGAFDAETQLRTITDFVRLIFPGEPPGCNVLWTKQDLKNYRLPAQEREAVAKLALGLNGVHDVYIGVGLQAHDSVGRKEEGVIAIPGFWMDVDIADEAHARKDLPSSVEEALSILDAFPHKPTLVVHTGHGLHAWWLFKNLWVFKGPADRERAKRQSVAFQSALQALGRERGVNLDSTPDLSRVLRIDGTFNRKTTPKLVHMLRVDETLRYEPEELILRPLPERPRLPSSHRTELPDAGKIIAGCGFLRNCVENQEETPENAWYAALSIVGSCKNGDEVAHEISRGHPKYKVKETDAKLKHAINDAGPRTCKNIKDTLNAERFCSTCPYWKKIKSPIQISEFDKQQEKLSDARATVAELTTKIKDDPGLAFASPYTEALALVREKDCGEWTRTKQILQKAGVSLKDINNEHLRLRGLRLLDQAQGEEEATAEDSLVLRDESLPDVRIPKTYSVTNDSTLQTVLTDVGPVVNRVAYAPVLISGRLEHVDSGGSSFLVTWGREGRWLRQVVDRGVALNKTKLVELASSGFPVASENAGALVKYLHAFEAANHGTLPVARVTNHLGWQGSAADGGFMVGRNFIRPDGSRANSASLDESAPTKWPSDAVFFRGDQPGENHFADPYREVGSMDKWLEAIKPLVDYPRVLLGVYAALVPPLLRILEAPNFIVDWASPTSRGKTTTLRAAASVWGYPDEEAADGALSTWDTTQVGVERLSAMQSDLPLILDDTKRLKKPELAEPIIYLVASGRGRNRGTKTSFEKGRSFKTVLLSSGESPVVNFTQAGGTRTRAIEIRRVPFGTPSKGTRTVVDNLNLAVRQNYGHAGPLFVQWLLENRSKWDKLREIYVAAQAQLCQAAKGPEAYRMAQYGAAIEVAAMAFHLSFDNPWDWSGPLDELWEDVVAEVDDAAGAKRALLDVYGYAISFAHNFDGRAPADHTPTTGWIGRWPAEDAWEYIGFLPHRIREFLIAKGYQPDAVVNDWRERGWLSADTGRPDTKSYRIDGKATRMIVIQRSAIDALVE